MKPCKDCPNNSKECLYDSMMWAPMICEETFEIFKKKCNKYRERVECAELSKKINDNLLKRFADSVKNIKPDNFHIMI